MRFSTWAFGACLSLGCGVLPGNPGIQSRVELRSFEGCVELEQYIEDQAVLDMRSQLEQSKDGYGYWRSGAMDFAAAGPTASGGAPAPQAGPTAYTTTNTQVGGVDEADFVKNDGTRIFVLTGGMLYANQSWPADQLHTVGKLKIDGWPREMFLTGDTVVVFSTLYRDYPLYSLGLACDPMWCGWYYGNTTKITVVDVSDLAAPKVAGEFFQPGAYNSSRRIGDSVRVVLANDFRYPPGVRWWPEYSAGLYDDQARLARAFDALMVENEKVIRAASIDQWLPHAWYRGKDHQDRDVPYECREFRRANAPTKLGILTVATLNLTDDAVLAHGETPPIKRTSIMGEPGHVYASTQSLYVASAHWWWWPEPGQVDHTYIHKFDLTDPTDAKYVASGGVDGHIVDQFSMDEDAKGFFRIAVTIASRKADLFDRWGRLELTNRISVLAENAGALAAVGHSEEIAPGETIRSSRFLGDKGFVVTAMNTDPFFTFDLSDPTHPHHVGALEVPGFSSYLHPIDDHTILALGVHTVPGNWSQRAIRISLYDISDFAHPVEKFTQLVGTAYGYSEALWDHHAFNYFPERKLLAIPFWDYSGNGTGNYWDSYTSDLRVFEVDSATGITPKGALQMRDVYMASSSYDWTWYWMPSVRRSVMADDYVYAISDAAIRVAKADSLSTPIATTLFDRAVVTTP